VEEQALSGLRTQESQIVEDITGLDRYFVKSSKMFGKKLMYTLVYTFYIF
jgi:hypothetical protein